MFDELKTRFRNCLGSPKGRKVRAIGVESYLCRCRKSMSPCASSSSSFSLQWQQSSCQPLSSPRELPGVSTLNPAQDPELTLGGSLGGGLLLGSGLWWHFGGWMELVT